MFLCVFSVSGPSGDAQRKKILETLEDKRSKTVTKASQYEEKYQQVCLWLFSWAVLSHCVFATSKQAAQTVDQLKDGIASIFTKIGCNVGAVGEMLEKTGITEANMMKYLGTRYFSAVGVSVISPLTLCPVLGMIEKRTNELLHQFQQLRARESGDEEKSAGAAAEPVRCLPACPFIHHCRLLAYRRAAVFSL